MFLPFLIVTCSTLWGQSKGAKIEWLRQNSHPIHIAPDNDDFSDLKPFGEAIGDAEIVLLGEQSHQDGSTFLAKVRLVKYLHQELGFDVLAFESPLWDIDQAWKRIQAGEASIPLLDSAIFSIWTKSEQVQALWEYIDATATGNQPLQLVGFDCQTMQLTTQHHAQAFQTRLQQWHPNYPAASIERIQAIFNLLFDYDPAFREVSEDERLFFVAELHGIAQRFDSIPHHEARFWAQNLRSLAQQFRDRWEFDFSDFLSNPDSVRSRRDVQMAENLLWLKNGPLKGRKIICWGASMHFSRGLSSSGEKVYRALTTMGDDLWEALGTKIYSLGFAAYEGEIHVSPQRTAHEIEVKKNSLEAFLAKSGAENAFLDFRGSASTNPWLQKPSVMHPFGYSAFKLKWPEHLDGIVFTKTMLPSTPREP